MGTGDNPSILPNDRSQCVGGAPGEQDKSLDQNKGNADGFEKGEAEKVLDGGR